jgi:hypothetical protein
VRLHHCSWRRARFALATLYGLAIGLAASGCLVDSNFCIQNADCPAEQICRVSVVDNSTRVCQLPDCRADADCWGTSQAPNGQVCSEGLCRFASGGDRFKAPDFCLTVANPKSPGYGQERCLSDDKGKVVLMFFGLLA